MFATSPFVLIALASALLLGLLKRRLSSRAIYRQLPRVGTDPGPLGLRTKAAKDEFFAQGQKLLDHGYAKHKDTPYIIQTCDDERIVIPDRFIEELKNLPDTQLSFKEELLGRFMGKYTKLDAVRGTNIHRDIVRFQLTKSLGNLVPQMKEEADFALKRSLSSCNTKEYTPTKASSLVFALIGQITSRRVVDEPTIARDPVWLQTIMGFTASVAVFCMTMRTISPVFRPVAQYILPCGQKLRSDIRQVTTLLQPVIRARQQEQRERRARGEEKGEDTDLPQDFVQWLSESATGKDAEPSAIIMKILFLIVAAMHSSAITAIHALYDLCAHPDLMEELREEAVKEIGAHGWTHATLLRLRKMESFLKESGRMNSAGIVSFQRLVLSPITLSNGVTIPPGTHICAASDARSRDPALYESPLEFRPMRFYMSAGTEADASNELDAANLFSSVAAGDSWFGAGRQACPGRWYASAQIKLVLSLLLIDYEMKFPDGQTERPKNWVKDEKTGPNMEQIILIKQRA